MAAGMIGTRNKTLRLTLVCSLGLAIFSLQSKAEDIEIIDAAEAEVEKYSTLGTRGFFRSVSESAVTLDIIEADVLEQQGQVDMLSIMSRVVPSFNVQDHPNINDASSLFHPANLRGLSSDSFLVLVNGKRRHRSAIINFLGGGLSDGAQGPDISVIPVSAVKQVDVLRGGAAAQYGSDAIAGVLNFALKEDSEGGSLSVRTGEYYAGDGQMWQMAGNLGLSLTEEGFLNLTYEYTQADPTSRSVQRADVAQLLSSGNTNVDPLAQKFGNPNLDYSHKFFFNAGIDLGDEDKAYAFGNWSDRKIDESGFFFRNPNSTTGIFTDSVGLPLVADLTGNGTGSCPNAWIPEIDNSIALESLKDDPDCFIFNEILPGGFTPQFGGRITDASVVVGTKGTVFEDIYFDVSATVGESEVAFNLRDTINPSFGPHSKTQFDLGSYKQLEKNLNIDASREIPVRGFAAPINLAWGFEYKHETFEIIAGEPESYRDGGLGAQGFLIGASGFPGFQDVDAGSWSRNNIGIYGDIELYMTDELTLASALRYEDYSDFGETLTGKIAARYQLNDSSAVRVALSTGFRAPTVGQSNVRNITSTFGDNGLENVATLPPTHPVSLQAGAVPLDAENSVSFSLGLVSAFENGLYLTIDYFNIQVEDRISQTSTQALTAEDTQALLDAGVANAESFRAVKYFTNDFDTSTQGIDLIAKYNFAMFSGSNHLSLAYNWTDTKVEDFTPSIINSVKISNLEDNLPAHRFILSNLYSKGDWSLLLQANYYGEYTEFHLRRANQRIDVGSELTFDAELTYNLSADLAVMVGAQNLFDNAPDDNPFATVNGAEYPVTSPMGINGGFYYVRGEYNF